MRLVCFSLLSTFLIFVQCSPKRSEPIKLATPINLQIGISLDSAKNLLKSAGWVWDSLVVDDSSKTRLKFLGIHIVGIDKPMQGVMIFKKGFLSSIFFFLGPDLKTIPFMKDFPTENDYSQVISYVKSLYGSPTEVEPSQTYWDIATPTGAETFLVSGSGGCIRFFGTPLWKNRHHGEPDTFHIKNIIPK